MILEAEVVGKFDHAGDANKLVYSPLPTPHTFRSSRHYTLDFDGSGGRAERFVRQTLVEDVSQDVIFGPSPALRGYSFILDYGFKPGALDLEKEMIFSYYRGLMDPGFTLNNLAITQRLYVFAKGNAVPPAQFVKDIVNPAIHRHQVIAAA